MGSRGARRADANLRDAQGMPGAGLTWATRGKALPASPTFQPYWGKPAVRNDRGGGGNVGIIRSPLPRHHLTRPVERKRKKRRRTEGLAMSLTTPLSVQKLQTALHDKAKGSPKFRFYALYDKVYREDVLAFAYECCKANRGAAGVDGQTFEDIEEYGLKKWLDELTQELKSRTYRPQPVRRVYIPKPDGKQRPLGVPAIKKRVAQTAAGFVLEPIFEADLQPEQYAYRPDRSALDAVRHVHKLLNTGHEQIV